MERNRREEPVVGEDPIVVIVEPRGEWGERRDERVEAPPEEKRPTREVNFSRRR